jgi:hypothetical protein
MSRRQDSNLHPPGSKPGALPDCATPRRICSCARSTRGTVTFPSRNVRTSLRCDRAGRRRGCGRSQGDGPRLPHGKGCSRITSAYLRPDRGVHRVGSGRRRRRSGRTGSGRPARGWNWSVDPWMLLAVFMTAFEVLYVRLENGAVKHSIQDFFASTWIVACERNGAGDPAPGPATRGRGCCENARVMTHSNRRARLELRSRQAPAAPRRLAPQLGVVLRRRVERDDLPVAAAVPGRRARLFADPAGHHRGRRGPARGPHDGVRRRPQRSRRGRASPVDPLGLRPAGRGQSHHRRRHGVAAGARWAPARSPRQGPAGRAT